MKTNSLVNTVMAASTNGQPVPEVGMGITILMWTDRHAGTITRVSPSGKTIWFREDNAKRIDKNGMSESQEYEYTPNTDGLEQVARLGKDGRWKSGARGIAIGYRRAYHDFSF